jgi:hypothetical protein
MSPAKPAPMTITSYSLAMLGEPETSASVWRPSVEDVSFVQMKPSFVRGVIS